MSSSLIFISISIVAYLAIIIVVGILYSKRNNSVDEFYLGGRKLGPLVTAMSAEASDMSSYLLMGLPGLAYFTGLADVTWTVIGLAVGTYLNWLFVAKRLRRYSEIAGNAITVPDFFANRFHDSGKAMLCIAAAVIIVFFVPYTASGFAACGKLFSTLLGIDYIPAMLVSAAVIVLYTTLGGFLAASITDLIQSIVMTIALVVVVFFGIHAAGGWNNVLENARSIPGYLNMTHTANAITHESGRYGFITILSTLAWGLGYFGMPHILLRFMAIDDPEKVKHSRRIATVWVVISMAVAILIGVVGLAMSKAGVIETFETSSAAEKIMVSIASYLSSFGVLPALIAGVILAGILASTMSTADSQLLAASSSVSQNLLGGVFGLKLSEKATMIVARLTVIAISVIGVFLARDPDSSVFGIVSFAWAGFGAAFGPTMLMCLFWRRMNKAGALAGMISGGAMVFIWEYVITPFGKSHGIRVLTVYELLPAFIVALIAIVIASLLTAAPEKSVTDDFDKVSAIR